MIAPFALGVTTPGVQNGCKIRPSHPGGTSLSRSFKISSGEHPRLSAYTHSFAANSFLNQEISQYPLYICISGLYKSLGTAG